jgi:hypothetical protein
MHQNQHGRVLKKALMEMAESCNRPHLLELTASEGQNVQAIELLEHAASLYPTPANNARVLL